MDRPARVHVLYLERAEDQRTADGKRSAGLHLEQTPGLGPYICTTCDAVADTWRNRCDNFQCALRMCCAEGALFRPSVAQFAVLSPRAALAYSLPAFGAWMAAQGTKRPTEALVVGAALRVGRRRRADQPGQQIAGADVAATESDLDESGIHFRTRRRDPDISR